MKKLVPIFVSVLVLAGCAGRNKKVREVEPRMLGVPESQVEQYLAGRIMELLEMPLDQGCFEIENLFDRIVSEHSADTSRYEYLKLTEIVSKYLYDPNSPLRDEDLYRPFALRMAGCEYTSREMKIACEYEAAHCALNARGTRAADFSFTTPKGRKMRLYDVESDVTVLFFSNPGCDACREIVELLSEDFVVQMQREGMLSVVNVYIDDDCQAWRDYCKEYPSFWICGYDYAHTIRKDLVYDVRAIPSVYLLDEEKRVILKDADVQRIMDRLFEMYNLNN